MSTNHLTESVTRPPGSFLDSPLCVHTCRS